jgi:cytochrome c biogenesis protein CcmG/thiol:disulfide interchange protein DsbE
MSDIETPTAARRWQRRRAPFIAAAIAVAMALLVGVLATRKPATTRIERSPLVGRAVPALAGPTLDGGPFRLGSRPGQWVLVNFFATWCVPCRREHPDLIRFADRHAATGDAIVVGVVYSDEPDAVRAFRRTNGGDWPMVLDPGGAIAVSFGVAAVPESYLIDPDGLVVAKLVGGLRDDQLERFFQQLRDSDR